MKTTSLHAKAGAGRNRRSGRVPMSKSELIRSMAARGKETGAIKTALEKKGFNVHYSEIYGAQQRVLA